MKTLSIIAPPGLICPKEGGKRAGIITDRTAAAVPDTPYYRRLLKEGSLLRAPAGGWIDPAADPQPAASKPAVKKGGK